MGPLCSRSRAGAFAPAEDTGEHAATAGASAARPPFQALTRVDIWILITMIADAVIAYLDLATSR